MNWAPESQCITLYLRLFWSMTFLQTCHYKPHCCVEQKITPRSLQRFKIDIPPPGNMQNWESKGSCGCKMTETAKELLWIKKKTGCKFVLVFIYHKSFAYVVMFYLCFIGFTRRKFKDDYNCKHKSILLVGSYFLIMICGFIQLSSILKQF